MSAWGRFNDEPEYLVESIHETLRSLTRWNSQITFVESTCVRFVFGFEIPLYGGCHGSDVEVGNLVLAVGGYGSVHLIYGRYLDTSRQEGRCQVLHISTTSLRSTSLETPALGYMACLARHPEESHALGHLSAGSGSGQHRTSIRLVVHAYPEFM